MLTSLLCVCLCKALAVLVETERAVDSWLTHSLDSPWAVEARHRGELQDWERQAKWWWSGPSHVATILPASRNATQPIFPHRTLARLQPIRGTHAFTRDVMHHRASQCYRSGIPFLLHSGISHTFWRVPPRRAGLSSNYYLDARQTASETRAVRISHPKNWAGPWKEPPSQGAFDKLPICMYSGSHIG